MVSRAILFIKYFAVVIVVTERGCGNFLLLLAIGFPSQEHSAHDSTDSVNSHYSRKTKPCEFRFEGKHT